MGTRGAVLLLILCGALAVFAAPQEDQGRPRGRQSGWYSSGARERGRPYNQRDPGDDEPSFGTRDDYGSRDPTVGGRRRNRPAGARRQGTPRGGAQRQPQPGNYNRDPRPQPQPDTSRQPVVGFVDPRQQPEYNPRPQPEYNPRPQPVYNPRPEPEYNPRPQPEYNPRPQPEYNPRPQPEYNPRPQPEYNPRPQPVYNPRPQPEYNPRPQPEYNPRPQPEYNPRPQPEYTQDSLIISDSSQRQPAQQPGRSANNRRLLPGGRYQGIGELNGDGPNDFVVGEDGVLCAPTCRGHCITRDRDCNCVQDMACFNEYKHRLEMPPPKDDLIQLPDCNTMECKTAKEPCGYKVQWPDGWCMCDIDPTCDARRTNNPYSKREADLDKLISQREAHMAELSRASRHSQKTKRQAMKTEILN